MEENKSCWSKVDKELWNSSLIPRTEKAINHLRHSKYKCCSPDKFFAWRTIAFLLSFGHWLLNTILTFMKHKFFLY